MHNLKLSQNGNNRLKIVVAVVIVATMFVLFLVFNIFSGYAADIVVQLSRQKSKLFIMN